MKVRLLRHPDQYTEDHGRPTSKPYYWPADREIPDGYEELEIVSSMKQWAEFFDAGGPPPPGVTDPVTPERPDLLDSVEAFSKHGVTEDDIDLVREKLLAAKAEMEKALARQEACSNHLIGLYNDEGIYFPTYQKHIAEGREPPDTLFRFCPDCGVELQKPAQYGRSPLEPLMEAKAEQNRLHVEMMKTRPPKCPICMVYDPAHDSDCPNYAAWQAQFAPKPKPSAALFDCAYCGVSIGELHKSKDCPTLVDADRGLAAREG